jgi:hypothetical protein
MQPFWLSLVAEAEEEGSSKTVAAVEAAVVVQVVP